METYFIPSTKMNFVNSKINQLNKKAKKLGKDSIELIVLKEHKSSRYDSKLGVEYEFVEYECCVKGESPKMDGWELIACVTPVFSSEGELLVKEVPGKSCPSSYRNSDMTCDYCKSNRKRTNVYVMHHKDGRYCKVGRNCIGDFLGNVDPNHLLRYAELMMDLDSSLKFDLDKYDDSKEFACVPIEQFLMAVQAVMKRYGFVSRSASYGEEKSTCDLAMEYCLDHESSKIIHSVELSEEDKKMVGDALLWGRSIPSDSHSTFLYDLGVCCRSNVVTYKNYAYVANLINSYKKQISFQEEKKNLRKSEYVGNVKERMEFSNVKIKSISNYGEGRFSGRVLSMEDQNGNILVWFTSVYEEWMEVGKVISFKATIKEHKIWRDVKQTQILRLVLTHTD